MCVHYKSCSQAASRLCHDTHALTCTHIPMRITKRGEHLCKLKVLLTHELGLRPYVKLRCAASGCRRTVSLMRCHAPCLLLIHVAHAHIRHTHTHTHTHAQTHTDTHLLCPFIVCACVWNVNHSEIINIVCVCVFGMHVRR